MNRTLAIGGSIVVAYSTLGGMWSITLTDMVQFVVKTIGVLLLLLPIAIVKAGGFSEMKPSCPPSTSTRWASAVRRSSRMS